MPTAPAPDLSGVVAQNLRSFADAFPGPVSAEEREKQKLEAQYRQAQIYHLTHPGKPASAYDPNDPYQVERLRGLRIRNDQVGKVRPGRAGAVDSLDETLDAADAAAGLAPGGSGYTPPPLPENGVAGDSPNELPYSDSNPPDGVVDPSIPLQPPPAEPAQADQEVEQSALPEGAEPPPESEDAPVALNGITRKLPISPAFAEAVTGGTPDVSLAQISAKQASTKATLDKDGITHYGNGMTRDMHGVVTYTQPDGAVLRRMPGSKTWLRQGKSGESASPNDSWTAHQLITLNEDPNDPTLKGEDGKPSIEKMQARLVEARKRVLPENDSNNEQGEKALDGLSEGDKLQVKMIAKGQTKPLSLSGFGAKNPRTVKIMKRVYQYNPDFKESTYDIHKATEKDYFGGGVSARNIKSLNTVTQHLLTLQNAADELKSTRFPAFNNVRNFIMNNIGDGRVKAFDTAMGTAATEIAAALKGGSPTVSEIEHWRDTIGNQSSPDQVKKVIGTVVDQMAGRINTLQSSYETAMGDPSNRRILSPEARTALEKLNRGSLAKIDDIAGGIDPEKKKPGYFIGGEKKAPDPASQPEKPPVAGQPWAKAKAAHDDAVARLQKDSNDSAAKNVLSFLNQNGFAP